MYKRQVLIKPSVSVFSKGTLKLLNPQGWYCLESNVAVFSEVDIQIDCRANLASSSGGTTVISAMGAGKIAAAGMNEWLKIDGKWNYLTLKL